MKRILVLAATLTLVACSTPAEQPKPATPAADAQADKDAVNKVRDAFAAAFNAGDAAKIGDLYSETAVMLPKDRPTVQGRAAIVEYNKGFFDQNSAKITLTPTRTILSGNMAFDEGTFTIEITPKAAGAKPVMDEGRYVVVLQREGDAWKVVEDIDNSSKGATPPPAESKPKESKPKK